MGYGAISATPFAPGVKPPFDVSRAKGYVYQTGVWVPLIVAGPLVSSPNRDVAAMVNVADLYRLFGEIGGADVDKAVPSSHVLDAQPMLAYLTNPDQPSIRQTNFTQIGANIHPTVPPPCVIQVGPAPTCVQLFTQQAICEFEGGKWFGPNASNPSAPSFPSCCALKNAFPATYGDNGSDPLGIVPDSQKAVRNDFYKMVQIDQPNCAAQPVNDVYPDVKLVELYQIDEAAPVPHARQGGYGPLRRHARGWRLHAELSRQARDATAIDELQRAVLDAGRDPELRSIVCRGRESGQARQSAGHQQLDVVLAEHPVDVELV